MNPSDHGIPTFGLKKGSLMLNAARTGVVIRRMMLPRALELAENNGNSYHAISNANWEQAKRELTGEPDVFSKEVIL